MTLVLEETKVKVRHTTELDPVLLSNVDPVAKIEKRLKAFIANTDWIYETLNLIDKALYNKTELNRLDLWAVERLDLEVSVENDTLVLTDRYQRVFTTEMLNNLRERIISLTTAYAGKVLKTPKLHHMEKSFTRVLRKSLTRELTQEELSILSDAYLRIENGKVVNLRGQQVKLPKFGILSFFYNF